MYLLCIVSVRRSRLVIEEANAMNFQIRDAITSNVKGDSANEFRDTVEDAISRGDEHLLPGLGVFLEKWWKTSSAAEQEAFTEKLSKAFQN